MLVHGERFLLGEWAFVRVGDAFDAEVPQWVAVGRLLFEHGVFQWNPTIVGGQPSHAYQFTPLYPLAIVSQLLPLWLLYAGLKTLLMTLAGYGMFRLGREYLGFSTTLSTAVAAVFALNLHTQPYPLVFMPFNYAFPLIFLWTLGIGAPPGRRWLWAGVALAAVSLLSYPALTAPYHATLHVLLILALNPLHRGRTREFLGRAVLFWLAYTLLYVPYLYALADFAAIAQRVRTYVHADVLTHLMEAGPNILARSLLAAPIGGAIALAGRSAAVRGALVLAAVPLGLSAFFYSSLSDVLRDSLIAKLDFGHFDFLAPIVLTILAFAGLDAVTRSPGLRRRWAGGGVIGFLAAAPALFRTSAWMNLLVLNVLVLVGLALFLRSEGADPRSWTSRRRLGLATVVVVIVLVLRVHMVFENQETTPYRRYFGAAASAARIPSPPEATRAVLIGFYPTPLHVAGIETADAFTPLFPRPYKDVWKLVIERQLTTSADHEDYETYPYSVDLLTYRARERFTHGLYRYPSCEAARFDEPLGWRMPLLLSMNVGTIVSLRPIPALEAISEPVSTTCRDPLPVGSLWARLVRYFRPLPVWVYRPKDALPRGYVVNDAEVLASDAAVVAALARRSVDDFRRAVLLSATDGHRADPPGTARTAVPGTARLPIYEPDRLAYEVDTAGAAYLVVSNNFHRHWRATVDGHPAPLLRANHAFQAVRIDRGGRHDVVLRFQDPWLWWTYAAVPLGLGLMLAAARPLRRAGERGCATPRP